MKHLFFCMDFQIGFLSLHGDFYLGISSTCVVLFLRVKCRGIFQISVVIDVGCFTCSNISRSSFPMEATVSIYSSRVLVEPL